MSSKPVLPEAPNAADPLVIVRRAHRYVRLTVPIWSMALVLLATAALRTKTLGLWTQGHLAAWGIAGASAVLLLAWLTRLRRLTVRRTVRRLDARWNLRARIESAWELAGSDSPVARAQRIDLSRRMAGNPVPLRWWYRAGVALLGLAVAVNLVGVTEPVLAKRFAHTQPAVANDTPGIADQPPAAGAGVLTEAASPGIVSPAATKPPPLEQKKQTPEPESRSRKVDSEATITWMSPVGEIRATAIESVPLVAHVVTRSGLHHATLEVSVNGAPRASVPVSPEVANQISIVGEVRVRLELHLDELRLNPLDYVTYYLRAERNAPEPVPAVVSGIQFIEIKPLKEKREGPPPEPRDKGVIIAFFAILTNHVKVTKDTFTLLNAKSVSAKDTAPVLAREQRTATLAGRLDSIITKISADNLVEKKQYIPFSLEDGLPAAAAALDRAVSALKTGNLSRAYQDEQAALVALIACKEDFGQSEPPFMPEQRSMTDPFQDHANNRGTQEEPGLGKLEALSTREGAITQALGDLLSDRGHIGNPSEDISKLTEAQGTLARDIQQLSESLNPGDGEQLETENAGRAAGEAAEELAKGDLSRALARAAQVSRSLQEAMRQQELSGRAEAQAQLEDARRQLGQAEKQSSEAEKNAGLNAAAEQLRNASAAQAAHGSQKAATALAEVADAIDKLAGPAGDSGEGWAVAEQKAAAAQISLGTTTGAADRVARQLRRAREGLQSGGPNGESGAENKAKSEPGGAADADRDITDLKLAAQVAASLLSASVADLRDARGLESETDDMAIGRGNAARLIQAIERVEKALARRQPAGRRDETIRKFDPDEVDPEYRAAVEAYFGKLSEGAKP